MKFMQRSLLNLAICHAAFILGTIVTIVFFTSENGDDVLSQSRLQNELKSKSPTNNTSAKKRETDSDRSELALTETADQANEIKSDSHYPIIEIWKEIDGSVPIRGKSLYFRMFDDGVVEFDYQLRKENESGKPRYIFSIERTPPTKISEEEFSRFKAVLKDLTKSKNIKQEYKPVALTLDVITKLTILLNENGTTKRKIIINDSDYDVTYSKYEKKFPNLLINLIKEFHLLRVKLQEEGSG